MLTEKEIREEIKEIEYYLADLDLRLKDKSESEDFPMHLVKYQNYKCYKKAFEMVLNGIEFETGSYQRPNKNNSKIFFNTEGKRIEYAVKTTGKRKIIIYNL